MRRSVMSSWTADNTNSNEMTSTVKEQEVVPRMKTTTTPSPQRLEQALEAFVEDLEGLEGAVQRFEEALLKLEEGALKEGALEGLEDAIPLAPPTRDQSHEQQSQASDLNQTTKFY